MRKILFLPLAIGLSLVACDSGPLGPGSGGGCGDQACSGVPVPVRNVPALATLSAGAFHTCGLSVAGEAWCWGENRSGQLGAGITAETSAPVRVAGQLRFTTIEAGAYHTCALTAEGTAYCWGGGTLLGGAATPDLCGSAVCARTPVAVPGRTFTALAVGRQHTCGLDPSGAAYCWGFNFLGETGSSRFYELSAAHTRVPGTVAFATIAAGDRYTCALTGEGALYCWGLADQGQLARADVLNCPGVVPMRCSPAPVPAATTQRFLAISTGFSHACGLTAQRVAWCWGENGQGQIGDGTFVRREFPVVTTAGRTWSTINAGSSTTCATAQNGASYCWGINTFGKLGTGNRVDLAWEPVPIANGFSFVQFTGGDYHTCGLRADGAAYCWGADQVGQLGR